MTATTFRQMTARSVEAAEPLTFPDAAQPAASYAPPVYPKRVATIRMDYHGAPVELMLADRKIEEVEALIDGLLARAGWQLPTPPATAAPAKPARPAELSQAPHYKDDGTPCCPIHKSALKESNFGGLYCRSKADGELANSRGYCRYSWKEE
jgi:hypothetical protein